MQTNPSVSKLISYFTTLMALFYIVGGILLLSNQSLRARFSPSFCLAIGMGLIAYGIFRIYRSYILWKTYE